MFYDFSSAFNAIHPLPSSQPLEVSSWQMTDMRVDRHDGEMDYRLPHETWDLYIWHCDQ